MEFVIINLHPNEEGKKQLRGISVIPANNIVVNLPKERYQKIRKLIGACNRGENNFVEIFDGENFTSPK